MLELTTLSTKFGDSDPDNEDEDIDNEDEDNDNEDEEDEVEKEEDETVVQSVEGSLVGTCEGPYLREKVRGTITSRGSSCKLELEGIFFKHSFILN